MVSRGELPAVALVSLLPTGAAAADGVLGKPVDLSVRPGPVDALLASLQIGADHWLSSGMVTAEHAETRWATAKLTKRMKVVLLLRNPLEVCSSVVRAIAVLMVYDAAIFKALAELEGDKPMNVVASLSAEADLQITR